MLYADDLILLVESRDDLQSQMDRLCIYIDEIKIDINEKKTKVPVFTKRSSSKDIKTKTWFVGKKVDRRGKSYKYLRVALKNSGLFNEHVRQKLLKHSTHS